MSSADSVAADRLRSFVERIERLNEEVTALNADKREVYAEAKACGFDTKIIKQVVKRREQDPADRREADELLHLYLAALGEDLPAMVAEVHAAPHVHVRVQAREGSGAPPDIPQPVAAAVAPKANTGGGHEVAAPAPPAATSPPDREDDRAAGGAPIQAPIEDEGIPAFLRRKPGQKEWEPPGAVVLQVAEEAA